jgi:tetratricopeptide (TPR) repeat protein
MHVRALRLIAALVIAVLTASCAYYNIYWMAQDEYDTLMSSPDLPSLWDPFEKRNVSGQDAKLADSILKRCGKLIVLHPDSRWVDDALLLMGNCFMFKGDYANAAKKYDELLTLYEDSELRDEARYMKAYNLVLQGSTQQALTVLGELTQEAKDERIKERSLFLRARIYQKLDNCDRAVEMYELYVMTYFDGRRTKEARLRLARCLLKLARADEAVEVLEPLARRKDADGISAALQIGRAYRMLGRYEIAIETFESLAAGTDVDSLRARAKLETAATLLERNRPEEAITTLTEADSILTKEFRDLKAEATYCIGVICEKHLGDYDRATSSYDEAAKSPSSFGKLAAKRAQALKDIRRYQDAITDSTPEASQNRAMNMFLIAETYLEDLGLRKEAIRQFGAVVDSFPGDDYAAKSMLTLGSLLEADGDTLGPTYYRRVLDSFPGTVYANVARSRLGLPLADVVMETPDTSAVPDTIPTVVLPPEPAEGDTLPGQGAQMLPDDASRRVSSPQASRTQAPFRRSPEPAPGDTTFRSLDQDIGTRVPATAESVGVRGSDPERSAFEVTPGPDWVPPPAPGDSAGALPALDVQDTTGTTSVQDTTDTPSVRDTADTPSVQDTTGTSQSGRQAQ